MNKPSETIKKILDGMKAEHEHFTTQLQKELQDARDHGMTKTHIATLETRIQATKKTLAESRERLETEYKKALEAEAVARQQEEQQQAQHAETVKAQIKIQLRAAWLVAGGDIAEFEQTFPELYKAEMIRRTQAAAQENRPGPAATYFREF